MTILQKQALCSILSVSTNIPYTITKEVFWNCLNWWSYTLLISWQTIPKVYKNLFGKDYNSSITNIDQFNSIIQFINCITSSTNLDLLLRVFRENVLQKIKSQMTTKCDCNGTLLPKWLSACLLTKQLCPNLVAVT